jgi:hypothetical protein
MPEERARLTLHSTDLITGLGDTLYNLSYEYYRGYTIYSTERGTCCIHGPIDGCLRIGGYYAVFPDIEQAKILIKYFLANGHSSRESMKRSVPEQAFICLNRRSIYSPARRSGNTDQLVSRTLVS